MALKPSHTWWHPQGAPGSLKEVAKAAGWESAQSSGKWRAITRTFRHQDSQQWWVLEIVAGPYGPDQAERAVIATTDPGTLPDLTTWYLVVSLPASLLEQERSQTLSSTALEEVIRLYGLRQWIEQSYKQVKYVLGWAQYQVRSDQAMRRHWQMICCAFSFCWYHASHLCPEIFGKQPQEASDTAVLAFPTVPVQATGTGEKKQRGNARSTSGVLANGSADGASMVGTLGSAVALLESMVWAAPATCTATPA
jgi:hypothetical protein